MSFQLDVDAYFRRICLRRPSQATVESLHLIVAAHVQHIPFENLDVLLGRAISVQPADVEAKLVHAGRGGYCFEQNTLLLYVLRSLGYEASPISARVRLGRERDFTPARTHLFLRVEIDGETWLADVGVGALSCTAALRLQTGLLQPTPHESRRIVAQGQWQKELRSPDAVLYHQAKLGEDWVDVCEFTLEPMPAIDREVANWYTSAHPDSHFRNRLIVARSNGTGRISLANRELKFRDSQGRAQTRQLSSSEEILGALRTHFDLHFEPGTEFQCSGLQGD